MEMDSWDHDLAGDSERYRGRRRAILPHPRNRRLVVTLGLLTVVGLTALVTIPSLIDSPADTPGFAPPSRGGQSGPDRAAVSPSPPSSTSGPTPTATHRASVAPSPFKEVTIEAEAGPSEVILGGSAHVVSYKNASGGQIVSRLGNWGDSPGPGTLQISGVKIPRAGTYRIAIYYVNADSPGSHQAIVSWSGGTPTTVTFTGGRNCCGVRTVEAAFTTGTQSITMSNPDGTGPSIDKIVITAA